MPNERMEIMRILREPPLGRLIVELDARHYQKLTDIEDHRVRQRLLAAVGDLISFAGGYQVLVDAGLAPPLQISPESPEVLARKQAAFLRAMEGEREPDEELPFVQPPAAAPAPKTKALNLIEQIDAILQRVVEADPQLDGRSIHLEQGPSGSLLIRVDGKHYTQPAEIPDRNIQLAIKMALKEWDNR